jgi:hypothetical protein
VKKILFISGSVGLGHVSRGVRHGAGLKATYSARTPGSLAALAVANIRKEAAWPAIPADGVRTAARILRDLLAAHA